MDIKIFDELYDQYEGVVCFFDLNDQIVYSNKRFADLLGYSRVQLIDTKISALISPEDRNEFLNHVYIKAKKSSITIRFYQASGAHVYLSLNAFKFTDNILLLGNQVRREYKAFGFDIIRDEVLSLSEDMEFDAHDISEVVSGNIDSLKIALNNMPLDFWIKDRNYRYVFMNSLLMKKINLKDDEYQNKNDFEIFETEIANDFLTSDLETIKARKKTQYTFESKSRRFSKWTEVSKVPLYNLQGDFIGLIGCALDITAVKTREQQLHDQNESLVRILQNLYNIVLCVDSNGNLDQVYGLHHEELDNGIGSSYQQVFHDYPEIIKRIDEGFNRIESKTQMTIFNHNLELMIKSIPLSDNFIKVLIVGKEVE